MYINSSTPHLSLSLSSYLTKNQKLPKKEISKGKMDAHLRAASPRVYQEIEPASERVDEKDYETLILYLPGFRKDQLRVQLTTKGNLIISGERPVEGNRWSRFRMEFPASKNCDHTNIRAKFEDGTLYIIQPKLIVSEEKQDEGKPTITEPPKNVQKEPVDEPIPPKNAQEQDSSMTNPTEQINEKKTNESANARKFPEKENQPENTNSDYQSAPTDFNRVSQEEKRNDMTEDGKITRNASEKYAGDGLGNAVGGVASKMKMLRNVKNLVLVVLMVLVLGMYVKNWVSPWKKAENSDL